MLVTTREHCVAKMKKSGVGLSVQVSCMQVVKTAVPFPFSLPTLGTWRSRSISPKPRPNRGPSGLERYQLEVALRVAENVHQGRDAFQRDRGMGRREPTGPYALGAGARCSPVPGRQSPGSDASGAGGSSGEMVL